MGTLRRDCLDYVLILDERHLRPILTLYSAYYNETCTHLGLSKNAPRQRAVQRIGTIVTVPVPVGAPSTPFARSGRPLGLIAQPNGRLAGLCGYLGMVEGGELAAATQDATIDDHGVYVRRQA